MKNKTNKFKINSFKAIVLVVLFLGALINPNITGLNNQAHAYISNYAQCVSSTIPSTLSINEKKSVSVTVKNLGKATWKRFIPGENERLTYPYRLGFKNTTWKTGRVNLDKDIVQGETHTFNFEITAPSAPGNYPGNWQMLQEYKTWFGQTCGPAIIKVQSSKEETINTLDYFISKNPNKGLGGSHHLGQTVKGNTSYYVKSHRESFEIHRWDNNYIYLVEDHRINGGGTYKFSNGIWMKRFMKVGDSIRVNNQAQWYSLDKTTKKCTPSNTKSFPYTMTLESHIPAYQAGGKLGIQDVIVLKYDYGSDYEKFYYSKNWGWIKWELYNSRGVLKIATVFNSPRQLIRPNIAASCTR